MLSIDSSVTYHTDTISPRRMHALLLLLLLHSTYSAERQYFHGADHEDIRSSPIHFVAFA